RMNRRSEQVQAMRVDAAQIVPVQGEAMAIEELENLDGDLAPVLDAVAKLRGGEDAIFAMSREIDHDGRHFVDRRAQEKMIVRHFIRPSETSGQFEKPTDIAFRIRCRGRDIA